MSGMLEIIDLNAVWKGNLEAISDYLCGSGHVIPKHDWSLYGKALYKSLY